MFLSYKYVIILLTVLLVPILVLAIRRKHSIQSPQRNLSLFLLVTLLSLMALSQAVFVINFGYTAAYSPDYYVYVRDSKVIICDGLFSPTNQHENIYYQQFPILTLLLSDLSIITNLDTLVVARTVTTLLPLLLTLPLYIILKSLFGLREKISVITLATTAIVVNLYLLYNVYTGAPVALGIYAMLMIVALIVTPRCNPPSTILSGTFFGVLILVHGLSSITLLFLMILLLITQKTIISKVTSNHPLKVTKSLFKMIAFVTVFYVLFSSAVIAYSQSISNLLTYFEIVRDILLGKEAVYAYAFYPSTIVRGYQDYLSALAVAFSISSVIATFVTHIFHKKTESDLSRLLLFCTSTLAILLLGIAMSGQFLSLEAGVPMAVSRYFGSYGFGLATIPTAYVLYKVSLAASKSKVRQLILALYIVILAVGVLMDPMILPSPSKSMSAYDTILERPVQAQLDGLADFLEYQPSEVINDVLVYPYQGNSYLEAKNIPDFRFESVYPDYYERLQQVTTHGALIFSSGQVDAYYPITTASE